jgi:hypothetical protein
MRKQCPTPHHLASTQAICSSLNFDFFIVRIGTSTFARVIHIAVGELARPRDAPRGFDLDAS